ncbi:MAG: DUF3443 family protein [Bdellovibrionia bacterium]
MKSLPVKSSLSVLLISTALGLTSCGSANNEENPPNLAAPTTALPYLRAAGNNVLPIQIGGSSICGQGGYLNEPCTTVTICVPGTNQCQTVSDILVDTGSVGLRVFSSALSFTLPNQTDSSGKTTAECAQFGIGSDWGPLASADVILGGEPRVNVPIQVINKGFAPPPTECVAADTDPASAGFNGILGVGPFNEDCGSSCAASSALHAFFNCPASGDCTAVALPNSAQPQNIVSKLPVDNNGVLLALDQLGIGGSSQVGGALILGIGTSTNNVPSGVNAYGLDEQGNFTTLFQGQSIPGSFIDSGSNGLYFPNIANLPICSDDTHAPGFYCPSSTQVLNASNLSESNGSSAAVDFAIGNADGLAQGSGTAFVELGGPASDTFDWGLPFFYGRAVFLGIEGKSSTLGSDRYIAY